MDVLGPYAAVQELDGVCSGILEGRGPINKANARSLAKDLSLSLSRLGPKLNHALEPVLDDFRRDLNQLAARLETGQGARIVQLSLGSLRQRFELPATTTSAWRDAVDAFADPATSSYDCELRLRQLSDLARARGHDWSALAPLIEDVLSDRAYAIARFRAVDAAGDYAGASEMDRVSFVEPTLEEPPAIGEVAVWLIFIRARLQRGWLQVGPVQFFDGKTFPERFRETAPQYRDLDETFCLPPELDTWEEEGFWFSESAVEDRVFARVWLTGGPLASALERGREIASAAVELAAPNSRWILLDGAMAWRPPAGSFYGKSFADPRVIKEIESDVPVHFEPTGERLEELDANFLAAIADGESGARSALEDVRWFNSIGEMSTPAQRIALGTRILERRLSLAQANSDTWAASVRRYLLAAWLRRELYLELFESVSFCVSQLRSAEVAAQDLYAELHDRVFPVEIPGRRGVDLLAIPEVAPRVTQALRLGMVEHRLSREMEQITRDSRAASDAVARLEARFGILLERAMRQRNALLHGGNAEPVLLNSVDGFVRILGALAANEAMFAVIHTRAPLASLEQTRVEFLGVKASLQSGHDPTDALLPWLDPSK